MPENGKRAQKLDQFGMIAGIYNCDMFGDFKKKNSKLGCFSTKAEAGWYLGFFSYP